MALNPNDARFFRQRLAEIRKSKGLTQTALSVKLGKGRKYIGQVETGEIDTPPLDTIAEIAHILDVAIADLFFYQGYGDSTKELRSRIMRLVATEDASLLRKYYRLLLVATEK